jgi:hypothetical protein
MKKNMLREHALKIERIRVGNTVKYRYQNSPVFDQLVDCVEWINDNLQELENASA